MLPGRKSPWNTFAAPSGMRAASASCAASIAERSSRAELCACRCQRVLRRTLGFSSLGGATLDNEENYLIKKLFTALGAIQVENQARIRHSATVPSLGTSFGRGGATSFLQ